MRQGRQGAFLLWLACLAVKAEPISPIIASEPASSVVKFLEKKGLADLPISNIVPLPAVGSLHSMDLNPVEGSSLKVFMENQRQGFTFPDGQACEKDAHKLVTDYLFLQRPVSCFPNNANYPSSTRPGLTNNYASVDLL